jgi:hypothetical protein
MDHVVFIELEKEYMYTLPIASSAKFRYIAAAIKKILGYKFACKSITHILCNNF